ncbi:MAG: tRNA (adenosine(37)-N6)-threonylcarbamoyltransferase complex ATPase subunit type 1 TsaE [Acidobacteria bacterium]|uniref:tRNA threonylcarbamoyladenosine biosynthesis protein TsaE n=1 Tax=Candidatus Polarisedimenticola svalbardensis TaxID=2886004 RepID=A0A8J7C2X5_9BACT|nr:tRNA (adenosine(37)-N6)-threonylcarbamoyltransferase complex ATPase subunit type 1 TsaE [Candidatus Polarisedimenticola svalbardensis]
MADQSLPSVAEFDIRRTVHGPEGTARLGEEISGLLRGGEVILLHGSLGAGKTCFTQGLCRGLKVVQDVVSPTFTLVNTYDGRLLVHHLDFYRIEPGDDLMDIGVPDLLDQVWDGTAVLVVEWPELLLGELGADVPRLELLATRGEGPDDRIWHLRGIPSVPPSWIDIFDGGNTPPSAGE